MACFPGLAQAENSGIQYETDVPNVPDNESSPIPQKNDSGDTKPDGESNPEAGDSNAPGGAGTGDGGDSGTGGGTDKGQTNQGSGGGEGKAQSGSKPAGQVGDAKELVKVPSAANASSGDGSSPLVPILIAIAVLAAISVGAFFYRQRRQDAGSPISPKAS